MASSLLDTFGRNEVSSRQEGPGMWREVDRVFDNIARSFGRQGAERSEMRGGFAQDVLRPPAVGDAGETPSLPAQPAPEVVVPAQQTFIKVNRGAPAGSLNPVSDASEDDEGFTVFAELPGVLPGDLDIQFVEGTLSLSAERRAEAGGNGGKFHIKERPSGTFQRRFRIPFQANPDTIEAAFEQGVVRIFVPHPPETKPRTKKIELKG